MLGGALLVDADGVCGRPNAPKPEEGPDGGLNPDPKPDPELEPNPCCMMVGRWPLS